jgi:hypothetical protein
MPVRLNGSTSGYVELASPAVGGSTVLELPTDSIKPGMVLINTTTFSAASSVSVNNCFSATYDNYKIVLKCSTSAARNVFIRFRVSGSDNTAAEYFTNTIAGNDTAISGSRASAQTSGLILYADTQTLNAVSIDLYSPFIAEATTMTGMAQRSTNVSLTNLFTMAHKVNSSFDGISIISDTGNLTGTFRVYGYRNSL